MGPLGDQILFLIADYYSTYEGEARDLDLDPVFVQMVEKNYHRKKWKILFGINIPIMLTHVLSFMKRSPE